MTQQLSFGQIALLTAYSCGISAGQVLFKLAAQNWVPEAPIDERLAKLVLNGHFLAAISLYAGLSVMWVWVLSFIPLSRAYPFVALAFAITPLLGGALFEEPISPRLLLGLAVIVIGLFLAAG